MMRPSAAFRLSHVQYMHVALFFVEVREVEARAVYRLPFLHVASHSQVNALLVLQLLTFIQCVPFRRVYRGVRSSLCPL